MKLHTANDDRLEVKQDGLTVTLTVSTTHEQPWTVRTVQLYESELDWLIKGLQDSKAKISSRKAKPPNGRGLE